MNRQLVKSLFKKNLQKLSGSQHLEKKSCSMVAEPQVIVYPEVADLHRFIPINTCDICLSSPQHISCTKKAQEHLHMLGKLILPCQQGHFNTVLRITYETVVTFNISI